MYQTHMQTKPDWNAPDQTNLAQAKLLETIITYQVHLYHVHVASITHHARPAISARVTAILPIRQCRWPG